jgi:hypothetical protein
LAGCGAGTCVLSMVSSGAGTNLSGRTVLSYDFGKWHPACRSVDAAISALVGSRVHHGRDSAVVGALSLMALTGCPSEFGREGRIAKAVHKDTMELVIERCSPEKIEEVCGNGKGDTPECRKCR